MEQAFDSLAAYRKLEQSGMPEPQVDATVEVVKDVMQNLVAKEYLTAELDRRFGKVDERFGVMSERFGEMDRRFGEMDRRFDEMDRRFGEMDKRFGEMDQRFGEMDQRFGEIDQRFGEIDQRFGEIDQRFSEVDQRFTRLEAKVDTGFAEMGRRQAWGFVYMSALFIGLATLVLTAQQDSGGQAAAGQPAYSVESGPPPTATDPQPTQPANESSPSRAQ